MDQVTAVLVLPVTEAVNVFVAPLSSDALVGVTEMLTTGTGEPTVAETAAEREPSPPEPTADTAYQYVAPEETAVSRYEAEVTGVTVSFVYVPAWDVARYTW